MLKTFAIMNGFLGNIWLLIARNAGSSRVTDFDIKELQLIIFLCMDRANIIGKEECEKEGTADLYRHACSLLRDNDDQR
jgi:hypothetical protein